MNRAYGPDGFRCRGIFGGSTKEEGTDVEVSGYHRHQYAAWLRGGKGTEDLKDEALFVSSKCGFTMDYLKYHEELYFRGHVATRAVAHAYEAVYREDMSVVPGWFRQFHEHALFYKIALQELEVLGLHSKIETENEISDEALSLYKALCYGILFPPVNRSQALKETLWVYPKCNCFVYDRACSVVSSASKEDELSQIKYYIIDKFQKRRIKGCNTGICEQTFAWLKNYASALNEMRTNRHHFMTMYLAKKHNESTDKGEAVYISRFAKK
ncbi:Uncharacterized protein SCF082_LOCUS17766, partial [Durusdinium trenchii]